MIFEMVIGAIVEMGVEGAWEKAQRREAIIKILQRVGLKPDAPPPDFDSVYAYTLVEYGVGRPKPILDFFRHDFIRDAFRQSFEKQDPSILYREAESLIEWHKVGDDLRQMDIDPRREFARFTAVFNEIVDRTCTPAEVRRDQKLDDIYGNLHQRTGEIIERLDGLGALEEIRKELARLSQSYQSREFIAASTDVQLKVFIGPEIARPLDEIRQETAAWRTKSAELRRFTVTPAGKRLKVFISSKMAELRDVREIVRDTLRARGFEVFAYEESAGARPETVIATSLQAVEEADCYVGIFWREYGQVTVEEYRHARKHKRPCFIYIRDKDSLREAQLEAFLETEVYDRRAGVTYDYFVSALQLGDKVSDDIMAWWTTYFRQLLAQHDAADASWEKIKRITEQLQLQPDTVAVGIING